MKEMEIDRTVFSIGSLNESDQDIAYWHSLTPEKRLEAMEIMRQINYGYDPTTERIQRILEVVKLK